MRLNHARIIGTCDTVKATSSVWLAPDSFRGVLVVLQAVLVAVATRPGVFYRVPAARLALDGVIYL